MSRKLGHGFDVVFVDAHQHVIYLMKCMGTGGVSEMPTCQEKILVLDRYDKISPRQNSQD